MGLRILFTSLASRIFFQYFVILQFSVRALSSEEQIKNFYNDDKDSVILIEPYQIIIHLSVKLIMPQIRLHLVQFLISFCKLVSQTTVSKQLNGIYSGVLGLEMMVSVLLRPVAAKTDSKERKGPLCKASARCYKSYLAPWPQLCAMPLTVAYIYTCIYSANSVAYRCKGVLYY